MAGAMTAIVGAAVLVLSLVLSSSATVYTVGDSSGWTAGVDYSTWTSDKTFAVGDTLVFKYGGGFHTVDEVSSTDYSSCTAGNALTSDSSGSTSITLKTPGTHYFICGSPGHCAQGMKLAAKVGAATGAGGSASPTPSGGTPSTPSVSTPGTPSFTTPTVATHSSTAMVSPSTAALFSAAALLVYALS
ncbi:blue copper protein-like [Aristolochia californica]|uniref:blue copper protein-like n=1 Tax=Aristolochia californica TaxID=171875 RepID=UPI0035DAA14D